MIPRQPLSRIEKGQRAEQQALTFLQSKGLKLIAKNFRCYFGEIDLIMQDQAYVVFIEVRSRQQTQYGNALDSVNQTKINKLVKTATYFMQGKKWLYKVRSRFDIIAIHPIAGNQQMEWIKNAFTA